MPSVRRVRKILVDCQDFCLEAVPWAGEFIPFFDAVNSPCESPQKSSIKADA